ncbi:S-adenosyl-L-methionine-dependent methyltransferase [Hypoxylon fuscum]|nr:S-adenosyl-L-methionine-dependent methyltransferase [Hypoxylon fuscum]
MQALGALCLDKWTAEFLANYPNATVIHLACGLDSRYQRLQLELTNIHWINIDLPDVMELRSKLILNPVGNYASIAVDVIEETWLEHIPADGATIVICEGLLMYLEEKVSKILIRQLVNHFKSGQLIVDRVGTMMASIQDSVSDLRASSSTFQWGIDDPHMLEEIHPPLKMIDCLGPAELGGFSRMPLSTRLMLSTYSYLPWVRYLSSYARFDFRCFGYWHGIFNIN